MRHILLALLFTLALPAISRSDQHRIVGRVLDAETLRPLANVSVLSSPGGKSTTTDSSGMFWVDADSLNTSMSFALTGYRHQERELSPSEEDVRVLLVAVDYTMDEIVVTATRQNIGRDHAPSPVEVISRQDIDLAAGSSVAEVLNGLPGLFIRSYGGTGSLQTCSIRGMSAEHTLVLLDGRSITGSQNDQLDLGILSTGNIERMEVVRGGYSSLYGADAIGGVINLITRQPADGFAGSVSSSVGSYGFFAYELGLSGSSDATGWRGTFRRENGRGNFAFDFSDGSTSTRVYRSDSDFEMLFADAALNHAFSNAVQSHLLLTYSAADRGTPGPFTDVASVPQGRLNDKTVRGMAAVNWTASNHVSTSFTGTYLYSEQRYTDVFAGEPYRTTSRNNAFTLSPTVTGDFSPMLKGTVGWELSRSWIRSDDVNTVTRWQGSMFLTTEHNVAVPFDVNLFPSIRYDAFSDVSGDVSPKLGVNLGLSPSLRIRSSIGKSYRVPTFNDLYWKYGGNPDLKPERSVSFDAGLTSRLNFFGVLVLDAGYFTVSARDRIIWAPAAGGLWTPQNITSSRSTGAEVSMEWTGRSGMLSFSANSTWITARKTSADFPGDPSMGKILAYSPAQTVHASVRCVIEPLIVSLEDLWIDERYSDTMNENVVPAYNVVSATVRVNLPFGAWRGWVKLGVSNILDKSYQVIDSYPMPGREVRVTLGADV